MADAAPESRPVAPRGARRDLTSGPITRTLLAFALPTLASNMLQSLNGSINAIWVGKFLGEDALAATSNANLIMFLMFAGVFGFGMAATIIVGQNVGRRDMAEARRALGTAIGAFVAVAAVIAVLGWIFAPALLRVLATPPEAMPMALAYLRVIFLSIPPVFFMVLLMMGLRGVGDSITPLIFMGVNVFLDSTLNPVFILGLGPAPQMGIAGSAVATLIASIGSLGGMIAYIYARDLPVRLRGAEWRYLIPDRALMRVILSKGFPMGLQMLVVSGAALTMIGIVNREGVVVTAAYGVTQQLWTYIQMPAMAVGAAVSAMAAQNIGAGRWDRLAQITRSAIIINTIITGALVVLLTIVDRAALGLFLQDGSPAMDIARHIQLVGSWGFVLFGMTLVLFGIVRANGAVYGPLLILFASMVPVRLGLTWLFYPRFGIEALWWSFPAGSIASAGLSVLYYRYGRWREARLIEEVHQEEAKERCFADGEPGGSLQPTG
jgi:putative MATE family efflux protein